METADLDALFLLSLCAGPLDSRSDDAQCVGVSWMPSLGVGRDTRDVAVLRQTGPVIFWAAFLAAGTVVVCFAAPWYGAALMITLLDVPAYLVLSPRVVVTPDTVRIDNERFPI